MAFNAGLAGPLLPTTGATGRLAPGVGLAPGLLAVLSTALGAGFADLAGWTVFAVTAADFFDFGVDIWEPRCCTPMRSIKAIAAAVCAGTKRNLQASFTGEHLECSPCGGLACRERSHRLAGSGGAAVALTKRAADYTYRSVSGRPTSSGWPLLGFDAGAGDFKLTPASLQFAIP